MSIYDNLYLYPVNGSINKKHLTMEWRLAKYSDPSDLLYHNVEEQFAINDISDLEKLPIYKEVHKKNNRLIMPNAKVARIFKHTLFENFSLGKFTDEELQLRKEHEESLKQDEADRVAWIDSILDSIKKENPDSEYLWTWENFAKVSESIREDLINLLVEYFKKNGCPFTYKDIDEDNHRDMDGYFPNGFIGGLQSYLKKLRPMFTPDHIRYLVYSLEDCGCEITDLFNEISEDDDIELRLLLSPSTAPRYVDDFMITSDDELAVDFFSNFANIISCALNRINDEKLYSTKNISVAHNAEKHIEIINVLDKSEDNNE